MSCDVEMEHDVEKREVTNSLIEQSEFLKYGQSNRKSNKISPGELTDAVVGWVGNTVVTKTSNPVASVKKRRPVERSFTDFHFQGPIHGDDYWSNSSNTNSSDINVRCVGDREKTFPIPAWKSNIEQGTFRYIPDNGSYRTLKFMYDDRREWYTIRKKHPEKVSSAWHQNCKRLQREMRRQLKKDLGRVEKERISNSSRSVSTRNNIEPFGGGDTIRSNSFIQPKDESQSEQTTPIKDLNSSFRQRAETVAEIEINSGYSEASKPPIKKETRVKSTHSDGAVSIIRKMKTIHEREVEALTPNPKPHYSIPSNNQMLKSASDLFIENFSSRISALEDEIKKDSKWLRKHDSEFSKMQSNRPKYREPARTNMKDSGSSTTTPRQQFKAEALGCEVFSVKPMVQKELKPLTDKGKSHSRHSNHSQDSKRSTSHSKSSLSTNTQNTINDALINYASEMENGHSRHNSTPENSKHAMFNTLTGTKINTYSSRRSSKGFTTPSTITLCDSTPSPNGLQQARHLEPYQQITIEKKTDKRETIHNVPAIQNMTGLLPEISGKRLEVTNIAHRLL